MRTHLGFTLLEVLITLIVLAVGMLGLANLQSKVHTAELESYQRAHAVLLLQDMVDRINTNRANAASYVTGANSTVGTSSATCSGNPSATQDLCEWGNNLSGAAEKSGSSSVGAMIGARGCVEQLQAINAGTGVCLPGIYRVSVVWQGLNDTVTPSLTCGAGNYGGTSSQEPKRRVVSANVTIGTPGCT